MNRLPRFLGAKIVGGITRLYSSKTGFLSTPGIDHVVLVSLFSYRIPGFSMGTKRLGASREPLYAFLSWELGFSAPELFQEIGKLHPNSMQSFQVLENAWFLF